MPLGVEGQMDAAGTAVVGTLYAITRGDEASTLFGPASKLTVVCNALLNSGAGPLVAGASQKTTTPTITDRQAVWSKMESDLTIRLRVTDSEIQSDIVALAVSCANADLLYNKQIAVVGMPFGTTKAALLSAAGAIAAGGIVPATRACLIGPGVYDSTGTQRGGSYAAAVVASEIATNSDPTNDLDLWGLPNLTAIELGADGRPVFQRKVVSGAAVNDFEDLLQGGVSPLQPSRVPGGVMTTHLRTCYSTNTSYDNLYTRIIEDQVFIDVRDFLYDGGFLRMPNNDTTRRMIQSGVIALLTERGSWVRPVTQPDGTQGYNVYVSASADNRQVTVSYEGIIVRGITTIRVAANLSITV
jgi:hypothetical protein